MIDYQTLCKQGQAFQQTKLTHKEILKREIKLFADTLARQLGLEERYYKANITDEVATMPYVQANIHSFVEDGFELPKVNFDLGVTLEDAPEIYPKTTHFIKIKAAFTQSDRLLFEFLVIPKVAYSINLQEDDESRYRNLAESYVQLLMKSLS